MLDWLRDLIARYEAKARSDAKTLRDNPRPGTGAVLYLQDVLDRVHKRNEPRRKRLEKNKQ